MCVLYIVYGPVFRTFRQIDARVNILYGSQGFFERKKFKKNVFDNVIKNIYVQCTIFKML